MGDGANDIKYIPEGDIKNSLKATSTKALKQILEQSEKSICKIKSIPSGTGFFCLIPFPDKCHQLSVLIV